MNSNFTEKYREFLIENKGRDFENLERLVILGLGFIFSYLVFIPLLLIHTKIAGLKKSDYDLITFYLPLFIIEGTLNLGLTLLIPTGFFLPCFYLSLIFGYTLKALIVFDIYQSLFNKKFISTNLVNIPDKILSRKSIKGWPLSGLAK